MEKRECIKCKEIKELVEFYKKNESRHSTVCKVCENKKNWERKKIKMKTDDEYRKKRNFRNNEIKKRKRATDEEYRKKENVKKRERRKIKMKTDDEYRIKQNKKQTIRIITKRQNNPLYRLRYNLRKCIATIIREKFGETKSKTTSSVLGLEYDDFFKYIENLFQEGMTWDNRDEWHIDHIVPLSLAQTVDEVYYLNHYTNLRPLWVKDNISKGDRIDESNIELYNKFLRDMRNIYV